MKLTVSIDIDMDEDRQTLQAIQDGLLHVASKFFYARNTGLTKDRTISIIRHGELLTIGSFEVQL